MSQMDKDILSYSLATGFVIGIVSFAFYWSIHSLVLWKAKIK